MVNERYARQTMIDGWKQEALKDGTVAIVGAGALGSWTGVCLADMGVGSLELYDFDVIEPSNLNRYPFPKPARANTNKARYAEERLKGINPQINVHGIRARIDERTVTFLRSADIVVDAVDNYATRVLLNDIAIREGMPLVHGGTTAFGGNVAVYIPGVTPCIDCKLDIRYLMEQEAQRCDRNAEPSIVTTSVAIAAEMADQTRKILFYMRGNEDRDPPLFGVLRYDSENPYGDDNLSYKWTLDMDTVRKPDCRCMSGQVRGRLT